VNASESHPDSSHPDSPARIEIEGLVRSYDEGRTFAIDDVSLQVARGEFLVILGESGCGKTTLLKTLNRLQSPTAGTIRIDGQDTAAVNQVALRRRIGYVFQSIGLFPHMSVERNVAVVPSLLNWSSAAKKARVRQLLELVGLAPEQFSERAPQSLSGGQRQRVGLARALAARPALMLMDEPFGALDPITRDQLQRDYRRLHEQLELTSVMVTHDMTEALILADRIAVMQAGRILRLGAPRELLTDPQHEYVERLMATPRRQADLVEALAEP